jgi:hypothetical protein
MDGRLKLLLVAVALSAAAVITTSISLAGNSRASRTTTIGHFDRGPVRGIVEAEQAGRSSRIQLRVSLHGLRPNTGYQVVASPRPCSLTADFNGDSVVNAADLIVWGVVVNAGAGNDMFRATSASRLRALNGTRSVRVLDVSTPGRFTQRACAGIDVWEHAYY